MCCVCAAEKREEAVPDDALAVLIVHATALLGASLSQKPELLDAVYKFAGWKQAIVLGMCICVCYCVILLAAFCCGFCCCSLSPVEFLLFDSCRCCVACRNLSALVCRLFVLVILFSCPMTEDCAEFCVFSLFPP